MTTFINKQQIVDLVSGACFFGAGGGGALATGLGFANDLPDDAQIPFVTVDEAANDPNYFTAVAIYLGAPTDATNIADTAALAAFDALNQYTIAKYGKEIGYLVPGEMGAVNATLPFVIANQRRLAVIDGDGGGGRSLPVLPLASFSCFGVGTNPSIAGTSKAQTVQVNVGDPYVSEDLLLGLNNTKEFGGFAGVALWLMAPGDVQNAIPTRGTVTRSMVFGAVINSGAPDRVAQIFAMLQRDEPVVRVWQGTLESAGDTATGGFDFGSAVVKLADGTKLTAINQNENILLWGANQTTPLVIMPDSVNYLSINGDCFSNVEAPKFVGQPIYLIGLQAPLWMQQNPDAQMAVRATNEGVGYYGPYQPLEPVPAAEVTTSKEARLRV